MKIIKMTSRGNASNTYAVTEDGVNAVVIDPCSPFVLSSLSRSALECRAVLLTHGHFDHVGGCASLQSVGADIYCNEREKELIFSPEYLGLFGGVTVSRFKVTHTLKDGDELALCGLSFKVMHTAGHSAGSSCFVLGNAIFTGDTLFNCGIGRCDLYTGNFSELVKSVKRLYALDGDYTVYCGHGEDTTLDYERKNNPFVRWGQC